MFPCLILIFVTLWPLEKVPIMPTTCMFMCWLIMILKIKERWKMLLFVLRYGFQQVHKRCACHGYLLLIFRRKWRRYSGKLHHEVSLQRGENVSLCVSMINCKIVVVISLLIKMYECLEREKKNCINASWVISQEMSVHLYWVTLIFRMLIALLRGLNDILQIS